MVRGGAEHQGGSWGLCSLETSGGTLKSSEQGINWRDWCFGKIATISVCTVDWREANTEVRGACRQLLQEAIMICSRGKRGNL